MDDKRRFPGVLAGILSLAFALRILFTWSYPVWMDAAFMVELAKYPFMEVVEGVRRTIALPSSYLIYHFWVKISDAQVWVHLCPIVFDLLSIYVLFLIGRRLFGRKTALLAAFLCAVSPPMIDYVHFMRHPTFLTFFALVLLYLTLVISGVRRDDENPDPGGGPLVWTSLAAFLIFFIHTHYYSVFWIAMHVVAAAVFLPQLSYLPSDKSWVGSATSISIPAAVIQGVLFVSDIFFDAVKGVALDIHQDTLFTTVIKIFLYPLFAMAAWGAIALLRKSSPLDRRGLWILMIAPAAMLAITYVFVVLSPGLTYTLRYFLFVSPILLLLFSEIIVRGLRGPARYVMAVFLAGAILLPLGHSMYGYSIRPTVVDAMKKLEDRMRPGDEILSLPHPGTAVIEYYLGSQVKVLGVPEDFTVMDYTNEATYITLDDDRMDLVEEKIGDAERIWLLRFDRRFDFDPEKLLEIYLEDNWRIVESMRCMEQFPRYAVLELYERK